MLCLALLAFASSTFEAAPPACEPRVQPQYVFDYSEYAFEGTVVGHVGDMTLGWPKEADAPPPPGIVSGPVGVLLVVPTRAVYLPAAADTFAVVASGLGSLCQAVFTPLDRVRSDYPIGSRLAVTAHAEGRALEGLPLLHSAWDDALAETLVSFDPWPTSVLPPDLERNAQIDSATVVLRNRPDALALAVHARYVFEYLGDLLSLDRAAESEEREAILVKVMEYRDRGGRLFSTDVPQPCVDVAFLDRYLPDPSPPFLHRLEDSDFRQPQEYDGCGRYE